MLLPLLAVGVLAGGDQLLVSSFQPAAVQAFELPDATPEFVMGAGTPLGGTLGSVIGPDGLLYVASEATNEILRFEPSTGAYVDAFITDDPATPGNETGGLLAPTGVAFGPDGGLYVGSFVSDWVLRYDGRTGAFDRVFVASGDGNLDGPDSGMVFGPDGDLYVPSYNNRRVKRFDGDTGDFVINHFTPVVSGMRNPRAVLFEDDGTALVTSEGTDQVMRFDSVTGDFIEVFIGDDPATPGDESGGLDGPTGIVRTAQGEVLVGSVNTGQVLRYASDGTFLEVAVDSGVLGLALPVHLTMRPRTSPGCVGSPNSVGDGATIVARGSTSIAANDLTMEVTYAPANVLSVLVQGVASAPVSVGDGTLCLGVPLFRVGATMTDDTGRAAFPVDLAVPSVPAAQIVVGSTWDFQAMYRDAGGSSSLGYNFTSSLSATFDS